MKTLIAGSPLESLVWQTAIKKVRIRWRGATTFQEQMDFLRDLSNSIHAEQTRLIEEMTVNVTETGE